MTRRRLAITLAAAVLAVGVVAGRERAALELIQERTPQASASADDGINLERLRRGLASSPQVDPFARKNSGEAARTTALPALAKPPIPPLPFQYLGTLTQDGKTERFVMRGEELISIAAGQKIGEYRVESISEGSIAFTYLPLNARQTLDFQHP